MFPAHGVFISRLSRAKRLSRFLFKWKADIHCFCLQSLMTLLFLRKFCETYFIHLRKTKTRKNFWINGLISSLNHKKNMAIFQIIFPRKNSNLNSWDNFSYQISKLSFWIVGKLLIQKNKSNFSQVNTMHFHIEIAFVVVLFKQRHRTNKMLWGVCIW